MLRLCFHRGSVYTDSDSDDEKGGVSKKSLLIGVGTRKSNATGGVMSAGDAEGGVKAFLQLQDTRALLLLFRFFFWCSNSRAIRGP